MVPRSSTCIVVNTPPPYPITLQRAAKDFAPGKVSVRSYADERFSYVAICKRPRPEGPQQPAIDAVIPLTEDVMEAYRALPPHEVPRRARSQVGAMRC